MPFFSKKNKNSAKGKGNTITIECPECGFKQTEPRMAVSSNCRSCGIHFKINDGKAEIPKASPTGNFAPPQKEEPLPEPQKTHPVNVSSKPKVTVEPKVTTEPEPVIKSSSPSEKSTTPIRSEQTPQSEPSFLQKAAASAGLTNSKQKKREVKCFECDTVHSALMEASSTACPSCGFYIALKDYDITSSWNQRIQTRGNVIIHKKATVTGITIHCHDLTSNGDFSANVDCSGNFTVRSNSKITGEIHCKTLTVQKRAKVEFTHPVHCENAIIDGSVTGDFECSGKLSLQKKSTLTGDIKVATMSVEEGAKHHGRISIGQ